MASLTHPGVYIEEFAPGAPIQGVGTSTAAILAPALAGPLMEPTKLTSFDAFAKTFGDPVPGFFGWYAMRGFFENGGQVCYAVRVSNAARARLELQDRSAGAGLPSLLVLARNPGVPAPDIDVDVDDDAAVIAAALFQISAATIQVATGTTITVSAAHAARIARLRPGDVLTWNGIAEATAPVVSRIEDRTIRLVSPLDADYAAGSIQIADMVAGETTVVRVADHGDKLAAGSVVTIDEGGGASDTRIVKRVDAERLTPAITTWRVEFTTPVDRAFTDAATISSLEFELTVSQGAYSQPYGTLSMSPGHPRYVVDVVAADPDRRVDVQIAEPPSISPPADDRPRATAAAVALAGGAADDPSALAAGDYRAALDTLEAIDDVNMVAIPDRTDADVQQAVIDHCERMGTALRSSTAHAARRCSERGSIDVQRNGLDTARGLRRALLPLAARAARDRQPRRARPAVGPRRRRLRADRRDRGVHKAPARRRSSAARSASSAR